MKGTPPAYRPYLARDTFLMLEAQGDTTALQSTGIYRQVKGWMPAGKTAVCVLDDQGISAGASFLGPATIPIIGPLTSHFALRPERSADAEKERLGLWPSLGISGDAIDGLLTCVNFRFTKALFCPLAKALSRNPSVYSLSLPKEILLIEIS